MNRAHDFATVIAVFTLYFLYTRFEFAFLDANVLHSSSFGYVPWAEATQTSDFLGVFFA